MYVPALSLFSNVATGRAGGVSGCGCAGMCGCGGCGGGCGLGQADGETSWTDMFSTQVAGFPLWGWLAGAAAVLWMVSPGGAEYRQEKTKLRAKQVREQQELRSEYGGAKRVGSAVWRGTKRLATAATPRGF